VAELPKLSMKVLGRSLVVRLTRLSGEVLVLNADLIERIEPTPDSVVTLTNGSCFVVRESVDEIIEAVRGFKSAIMSGAFVPVVRDGGFVPQLHLYGHPTGEE
jgi:flagellar protein FlbD